VSSETKAMWWISSGISGLWHWGDRFSQWA
jgi:hypothetical protein